MKSRFALLLCVAVASWGCAPSVTPTSRPVPAPAEPSNKADIRVRTPGADIDIDARKTHGGSGRKIDVNVDTKNP